MDSLLAIASRRDERQYGTASLPADVVERILDAGRLAGSSRNRQPWVFVVPETTERIAALAEALSVPDNVRSAGFVVAIVATEPGAVTRFDAGRAAQNMLLAAWNEGFASCPNSVVDQEAARRALDVEGDEAVAIVLSFGFPQRFREIDERTAAEWSARANRKPLSEVVRRLR